MFSWLQYNTQFFPGCVLLCSPAAADLERDKRKQANDSEETWTWLSRYVSSFEIYFPEFFLTISVLMWKRLEDFTIYASAKNLLIELKIEGAKLVVVGRNADENGDK